MSIEEGKVSEDKDVIKSARLQEFSFILYIFQIVVHHLKINKMLD